MAREDLGWSALLGMGAATAAVLLVGVAAGWLADRVLATSPIFLLVGLALGIIAACVYTVSQFRRYMSD